MGGWGYPLALIGMALFGGAVIYGIVALVRYTGRDRRPVGDPGQAERLLAERFARSEIDDDEYRRCLSALRTG